MTPTQPPSGREEMTIQDKLRRSNQGGGVSKVTCPFCDRRIAVNKNGVIYRHLVPKRLLLWPNCTPKVVCHWSGKLAPQVEA